MHHHQVGRCTLPLSLSFFIQGNGALPWRSSLFLSLSLSPFL
jgi:hypothetical protein